MLYRSIDKEISSDCRPARRSLESFDHAINESLRMRGISVYLSFGMNRYYDLFPVAEGFGSFCQEFRHLDISEMFPEIANATE